MILASLPLNNLVRIFIHPGLRKNEKGFVSPIIRRFPKLSSDWQDFVGELEKNEVGVVIIGGVVPQEMSGVQRSLILRVDSEISHELIVDTDNVLPTEHVVIDIGQDASIDSIENIITIFAYEKYQALMDSIVRKSDETIRIIKNKAEGYQIQSHELLTELGRIEEKILSSSEIRSVEQKVLVFLREKFPTAGFSWSKIERLIKHDINEIALLPISGKGDNYAFLTFVSQKVVFDETFAYMVTYIHSIIEKYMAQEYDFNKSIPDTKVWEEALAQIQTPILLVRPSGEVALHNTFFGQLNIGVSECLRLKDKETILIGNKTYRIVRLDVFCDEQNMVFITLIPTGVSLDEINMSSEELGIIASSVAHELNNPIAGVLAALSVLGLEDNLNEESLSVISEMKKGARRCKDLIETFLGFSRAEQNAVNTGTVTESFHQALNLVRSRLIESNIKLEIEQKILDASSLDTNRSIFAMIMYMVLGEVITAFSHHGLLYEKNEMRVIKGRISDFDNGLKIEFFGNFDFSKQLGESMLIRHLAAQSKMDMQIDGKTIVFRKKLEHPTLI